MRFCSLDGESPAVAVTENGLARLVTPRADSLPSLFDAVMRGTPPALAAEPESNPHFGPPLRPGKVVAIGLNYRRHADESGVEPPERPLVFAKFPSSVVGPSAPIVIDPALAERVDWEVELAVVVGRRMRNVSANDSLEYVFGYTVAERRVRPRRSVLGWAVDSWQELRQLLPSWTGDRDPGRIGVDRRPAPDHAGQR